MPAAGRNPAAGVAWTQLRARLEELPPAELIRVVRALYERSAENRRFLAASLLGSSPAAVLEDYREHIVHQFAATDPARSPRLGLARKAIRDYSKASGDAAGTAELMLTYLEAGNAFSRAHGDMSGSYYDSLSIVLRDLAEALRDSPSLYRSVAPRLAQLRQDARRVGWNWGGDVAEIVDRLESDLGGD